MGEVITQLHKELKGAQLRFQYNLVRGGFAAIGAAFIGAFFMLWKRPVGMAWITLTLLLVMFGGDFVLMGLLALVLLVVGSFLATVIAVLRYGSEATTQRVRAARRQLRARRQQIDVKRGWKYAATDLGLTSSYERKGERHTEIPKLVAVEVVSR